MTSKPTNNEITAARRLVATSLQTDAARLACQAASYEALDYFLSIPKGERRAAHWRQMTTAQKQNVIMLKLLRDFGDTTTGEIADWVARCDAEWGAEPTPVEAATIEALDDLVNRLGVQEYTAASAGRLADAKTHASERGAAERAREMYRAGVRAEQVRDGSWSVASATNVALVYRLDLDGRCSCKAGQNDLMCKHRALVVATKIAMVNAFWTYARAA
jgi:hypothetical protein